MDRKEYEKILSALKYEKILSAFQEEICRDPDADFFAYIEELAGKLSIRNKERGRIVINTLLLNLYGQDIESLGKDLIKLRVVKPKATAAPTERTALLPYLYKALSSYIS